mgnify:CR=1 FL=1
MDEVYNDVVTSNAYQKKYRLRSPVEFKKAFNSINRKQSGKFFTFLCSNNNLPFCRLGLIVPKKHIPLAVDRNKIIGLLSEILLIFCKASSTKSRLMLPSLFAGVGTMGLEAASRGAKTVVMIEKDRKIFELLESNIDSLDCAEQAVAVQADALSSIPLLRVPRPVDVAFLDPPYAMMKNDSLHERILEQISKIEPLLHSEGLIVLRTPVDPYRISHSIDTLAGPEIQKEGSGMWILFYGKKTES